MSEFAEFETIVSGMVDEVFGDPVTFFPRVKGEVSSVADPVRPPVTVVGIVDINPRTVTPKGKEQYDAFQPNLTGEKVHVSFDENKFLTVARPKQSDRIYAVLKSGAFTYEIASIEPDELGRIVCVCKILGKGLIV